MPEALTSAWRGLPAFEGRSSLRSWLYTIATNSSLNLIARRPKRVLPIDYSGSMDPHDGLAGPEARYELRESVELAFVAALQHLPPRQRAALILREVLGFSARETAEALDTTPVSIDSALQRAHKTIEKRLPEQSQQAALRALDDARLRELVDGYMEAWESADVSAIAAMLADDAMLAMPPWREWYAGREAIADFLARFPLGQGPRARLAPTRANGQPAFAHYYWDADAEAFIPHAIHVLGLRGDRIQDITIFRTPEVFARFGLPERIED